MAWQISDDRPIYVQLIELVKLKIIAGDYAPGQRIPGVRDLAAEASVNPNTMQKALATLEEEGLLYSQRTAGRFVTEDETVIQQAKEQYARMQVEDFLFTMMAMGFNRQETIQILKKIVEEEPSYDN